MEALSDLFLQFISFTHRMTLSYGWDIILLTLTIRVLMLPLTISSTRSMKGMQAAQPRIKELQAKYKDDPTRLNKETMALYKEIGFNPIMGCLPMLLQIPIFIILYKVLRFPELNNFIFVNTSFYGMDLTSIPFTKITPDFLGNIHAVMPGMYDLSFLGIEYFKNSYFYLPSLFVVIPMIVTTVAQQMLMTVDPQQKSMMWMMNIMMAYFSVIMPTGVLLYWSSSNAFALIQMWVQKRPEIKEKKAGGNSDQTSVKKSDQPETAATKKKPKQGGQKSGKKKKKK